jgi:hypothetical protein
MREQLTSLLNLKPAGNQSEVSDEQIIAAVTELQCQAKARAGERAAEKEITDLIAESCGALSREDAKRVLASRAVANPKKFKGK